MLTPANTEIAVVFKKTGEKTVEWYAGSTYTYYGNDIRSLYWYHFPNYAVSGTEDGSDLQLELKDGLTFVGGDGTTNRPFYPQPPGATDNSGGGGGADYTKVYEQIISSLTYSAEKNAELAEAVSSQTEILQLQTEAIQEQADTDRRNLNIKLELEPENKLYNTVTSSKDLILTVEGIQKSSVMFRYKINNGTWTGWSELPEDDILTVNGLTNGYNTITVTVKNDYGTTKTESVGIFRL